MSDFRILVGDCRTELSGVAVVDAIVTDPPYELGFMGKRWDKAGVAFDPATWRACYDVLRDGGRMLAFGGSRTHHRIWCAIEDAGFVIEDTMMWLYGSGFPKHRSKLKPAYEPICVARKGGVSELNIDDARIESGADYHDLTVTQGVGTATSFNVRKEARTFEPAAGRWPANVVLDEEAAAMLDEQSGIAPAAKPRAGGFRPDGAVKGSVDFKQGARATYPVVRGDSGGASRFFYCAKASRAERERGLDGAPLAPGGSNAKGFTADVAKGQDRNRPVANNHPTVKPITLMRWLVRLVTLPGQTVLDPFTGSGTTGVACALEGRHFIGIERDAEYAEIARLRIGNAQPSLFAEGA